MPVYFRIWDTQPRPPNPGPQFATRLGIALNNTKIQSSWYLWVDTPESLLEMSSLLIKCWNRANRHMRPPIPLSHWTCNKVGNQVISMISSSVIFLLSVTSKLSVVWSAPARNFTGAYSLITNTFIAWGSLRPWQKCDTWRSRPYYWQLEGRVIRCMLI